MKVVAFVDLENVVLEAELLHFLVQENVQEPFTLYGFVAANKRLTPYLLGYAQRKFVTVVFSKADRDYADAILLDLFYETLYETPPDETVTFVVVSNDRSFRVVLYSIHRKRLYEHRDLHVWVVHSANVKWIDHTVVDLDVNVTDLGRQYYERVFTPRFVQYCLRRNVDPDLIERNHSVIQRIMSRLTEIQTHRRFGFDKFEQMAVDLARRLRVAKEVQHDNR